MSSPVYDSSKPVLVTGATGYLAGWLVKRLLEEGFTVHAAVRDPDNAAKVAHLRALEDSHPGTLVLFRADLLEEGSYDAAMAGCGVVFHTASPFTSKYDDAQTGLVDPALNGTRNVLNSANRTESVHRVVLTSSCAAIYVDNIDVAKAPGGQLTEAVWNTSSRLDHQAYSYSKTVAERAAWEIAEAQSRWRLVAVNPAFILGPGLAPAQTSESFNVMRQLGDGTMRPGAPPLEIGMVDVRDVAEAHMRAAFVPEANGRHIVFSEVHSFKDLADMLRPEFGEYPLPKREAPKWLIWLIGPLLSKNLSRPEIAASMGHRWAADNGKSKRELGMSYRPVDGAVREMFRQMVEAGVVKR